MPRTIVGTVSSDKNDKTIIVTVNTRKTHPLYRKQYTVSRKFMAHDEKNEAQIGDRVSIIETKPLSRRKRYTLERIIEKPVLREDTLDITKDETEKATKEARDHKKEDESADTPKEQDTKETAE